MEKNHNQPADKEQENTNQNANSAYSGLGSMQPGGSNGEQGKLNDYQDDEDKEIKKQIKILTMKILNTIQ